jgi:hypothetical protein
MSAGRNTVEYFSWQITPNNAVKATCEDARA